MVPVDDNSPPAIIDSIANDDASKKFRKVEVDSKDFFKGLTQSELKQALEMENKMAIEDRIIIETAEKRNYLESYIYAMRDRLNGPLKNYCTENEKSAIKAALESTEEWLYSIEGEEASKGQFIDKLNSLKKIPDKIELRVREEQNRPGNISKVEKQIELCKDFLSKLDDEDKNTLSDTIESTEKWLKDCLKKQQECGIDKDPVLTTDMINKKRESLHAVYQTFVKKEKKIPPPPPPPSSSSSSSRPSGVDKEAVPDDDKEAVPDEAEIENNNMEVD
jgi:heat shock protein 4